MKKYLFLALILIAASFTGCADHSKTIVECTQCHTYGFWAGLWHGIIAFPDFIGSLIWPNEVSMYAPNNNGPWYAFGFLIGVGGITFGASKSRK